MTKYKSLIAVPEKPIPIKAILLTQQQKNQILNLIDKFIKAVVIDIETKKIKKEITKQENLYVIRQVGKIIHGLSGVNSGHMLKRISKKDWRNSIPICRQSAIKLPEFLNFKTYLENFLSEGENHFPRILSDYIVSEYFEGELNCKMFKKIGIMFINDLERKSTKSFTTVEIFGLELKNPKINISSKLHIDRVTKRDLNFVKALSFENFDKNFPNGFIRAEDKNQIEVNSIISKTLVSLRMFLVSSVREGEKRSHTNSIIYRGDSIHFTRSEGRADLGILSRVDCENFPIFMKKISKFLDGTKFVLFNKKYPYLHTSYERYSDSLLRGDAVLRISNAIMCLEALFLDESNEEISYKLRNRTARLLSLFGLDGETILKDITLAYSIRSAYVHGSTISDDSQKKLSKIHSQQWISEEILLKKIQEYARVSFLNF